MIYRAKYDGKHEMKGKTEARFVIAGETAARTGINLIYPPGLHRELATGETIYVARVGNNSSDYILIGVEQDARADVRLENDENSVAVKEDGKIEIGGSDNGGLLIWAELEKQLQAVSDYLQGIADALSNAATGAQDGGAAYKSAIALKLKTLTLPDYSKVESDSVLHGAGGGNESSAKSQNGQQQSKASYALLQGNQSNAQLASTDSPIYYNSLEEAAIAWAKGYISKIEIYSTIYSMQVFGKKKFAFTTPEAGEKFSIKGVIPKVPPGGQAEAMIHNHPQEIGPSHHSETFSFADQATNRYYIDAGIIKTAYVLTSSGRLVEYLRNDIRGRLVRDIDPLTDPTSFDSLNQAAHFWARRYWADRRERLEYSYASRIVSNSKKGLAWYQCTPPKVVRGDVAYPDIPKGWQGQYKTEAAYICMPREPKLIQLFIKDLPHRPSVRLPLYHVAKRNLDYSHNSTRIEYIKENTEYYIWKAN